MCAAGRGRLTLFVERVLAGAVEQMNVLKIFPKHVSVPVMYVEHASVGLPAYMYLYYLRGMSAEDAQLSAVLFGPPTMSEANNARLLLLLQPQLHERVRRGWYSRHPLRPLRFTR